MKELLDPVTNFVSKCADLLLVHNPRGTALGALSGVVLHGLARFFSERVQMWLQLDTGRLPLYTLIAFGIIAGNLPALFRRRRLPDSIENALTVISIAEREGRISRTQAKMHYVALCNAVLRTVAPSESDKTPPIAPA